MSHVDLDDTSNCPVAGACETCGGVTGLAVATAATPVGVYCLTLDEACAEDGKLPRPRGWVGAIERSAAHCQHLGIDVDQMAAAIEREEEAAL